MNIEKIQFINNYTIGRLQQSSAKHRLTGNKSGVSSHALLSKDLFEYAKPPKQIYFQGGFCFIGNAFAEKFPRTFFNKIVESGIHCAYTGIKLVSQKDYSTLITSGILNKRGILAVKTLKNFKESMYPIEHAVFDMIEKLVKKNPNLKLQELLQLKYADADKVLSTQQQSIIKKMMIVANNILPEEEAKQELLPLLQKSLYKISDTEIEPVDRFRKKDFIYKLYDIKMSSNEAKNKLLKLASRLPSSSNSINAFIVKYSQPYKIKYINGKKAVIPRTSEEIGLRLIKPSLRTDDHIYPQKLFRLEEQQRVNAKKSSKESSRLRVTVLTSEYINGQKSDTLLDEFIKDGKDFIPKNMQKHLDELIYKCEVWLRQGKIEDASQLSNYILTLVNELNLRSSIVNLDLKDFPEILRKIKIAQIKHREKMPAKKYKSSGEIQQYYSDVFENRKKHRFACRYAQ